MVAWSIELLAGVCDLVVVAAPAGFAVPDALAVAGGETRTQSVRRALAAVPDDVEHVLVHDAARPFTPTGVVHRVLDALRTGEQAVVPVLPVSDTVKAVDDRGYVTRTYDRSVLRAVQTPQGFSRDVLVRAYASGAEATDDAALVEALGVRVRTVDGDPAAGKITSSADLAAAEAKVAAS